MNSASPQAPGITPALLTRVPSANPHVLSESASVLLDIVRFAAALFVVAGHLTLPELNTGFRDRRGLGEHAVPVFFVLSGFVIRFVTRSRPQSLRTFFIDRASRMYSVVLPAMGLTLLVSLLCFLINPSHYLQVWGGLSNHIFLRVLLNITFLSQSWGHNTIPLINTPFWSLSYECLYYIAYGLLFYLRGWRRAIAVFLWAAVTGPQVLFLLPIWWLGCWVYDLYHEIRQRPIARLLRLGALAYLLLGTLLDTTGHPALLNARSPFLSGSALSPAPWTPSISWRSAPTCLPSPAVSSAAPASSCSCFCPTPSPFPAAISGPGASAASPTAPSPSTSCTIPCSSWLSLLASSILPPTSSAFWSPSASACS